MKHTRPKVFSSRQQGFSLIELLIASTLGLVITLGGLAVFASATGTSRISEAQNRMNEDAQAALSLLSREIKMAGHKPIDSPPDTQPSALGSEPAKSQPSLTLHGCTGMLYEDASSVNDDKLRCEISTTSQPHSLFIHYETGTKKKKKLPNEVPPTDCLGFALDAQDGFYYIAKNRYYISTSPIIRSPTLYCKGNGGMGTPQPIVENIEDLQFSYGAMSTPSTVPKRVAGYLTATQVEKLATSTSKDDIATAWAQVLTVQICIVVRSDEKNLVSVNASSIYTKCDGTQDTSRTDRRLRRAYTTTVALRNRLI